MLNLNFKVLREEIDTKMKDPKVSTRMKRALLQLDIGIICVREQELIEEEEKSLDQ